MNELRTDICIIGGGPGGCAAAMRLGQLGVSAIVVERSNFPRDKVCGDALSGKVMRTLERLDSALADRVKRNDRAMASWGVTFVGPSGRSLRVPFTRHAHVGEAPGAILPRLTFDDLLFQHARSITGMRILEGTQARSFERTEDGWRISTSGPPITARMIIDASGANSSFARHVAGIELEPRHHAAGVRAYYTNVQGLDPDGFIELIFLRDLLPGYLWIFPLPGGRANVGLGLRSDVVRKRRTDLKALLTELLAGHPQLRDRFASAQLEGTIQGMGLPLASKRSKLSGDGYLLVGDAGHLIDPFTGEGISHAMISGGYAAEVSAEALAQNTIRADRLAAYDERVWKRLGRELAISTRLQSLADRAWLFDFVVDRANRNPALADTISSMFTDLELRERLKKPGFYMDLLLGRARAKA